MYYYYISVRFLFLSAGFLSGFYYFKTVPCSNNVYPEPKGDNKERRSIVAAASLQAKKAELSENLSGVVCQFQTPSAYNEKIVKKNK